MRVLVIFVVLLLAGCAADKSWEKTLAKSAQDQRNFYKFEGWKDPRTEAGRCRAKAATTAEFDACMKTETAAN